MIEGSWFLLHDSPEARPFGAIVVLHYLVKHIIKNVAASAGAFVVLVALRRLLSLTHLATCSTIRA